MSSAEVETVEEEIRALAEQARSAIIAAMNTAGRLHGDDKYEAAAALVGSAIVLGGFCNAVAVALSATCSGDMEESMRQCKQLANNCFKETLEEMLGVVAAAQKASVQ